MTVEKKANNYGDKSIGTLMIVLNCFWLFNYLERIWGGKLYLFMIPNWLIGLNVICALTCIFLAIRLIKRKISAWTALPVNIGLYCICLLIQTLITS